MRLAKQQQIFNRTEGRCAFCGIGLTLQTVTWDHVTPRFYGGSNTVANLVAACRSCNTKKDDMSVEEYRAAYHLGDFFIETLEGKKLRGHSAIKWVIKGAK